MAGRNVNRAGQQDPAAASGEGNGQLGIYRPGFQYQEASLRFFRRCVGDAVYERAMSSDVGKRHHYVVARAFLSQSDWEKFVWIEQHGSLDGFPK